MALTPEQKAAHEALDEAIQRVLMLQGTQGDEPLPNLVDWMIVAEGITFDEEGDQVGWHNLVFRGGQIRRSVALGLLEIGGELLIPTDEAV